MSVIRQIKALEGRGFFGGGGGGGGGSSGQQSQPATRTPDNLRSTDHVEFVIGLGQGQFKGLINGAKSFYIGETPLQAPDGTANFQNFKLEFFSGDGLNDTVVLNQDGAAISHSVGTSLAQNIPVVRQGTVSASATTVTALPTSGTYIGKVYYIAGDGYWVWTEKGWRRTNNPFVKFLGIRLVVQQLYKENDSGNYEWDVELKIEVKRSDQPDSAYQPAYVRTSNGGGRVRGIGGGPGSSDQALAGDEIPTLLIHGKTTSNYVKDLRIPVQPSNVPYVIRVTQLTKPINQYTSGGEYARVQWESFQEVTAQSLRLPNLAFVHGLGQASDQFSSLPDFYGIYDCMMVRVPTNYDPVARTYTGLWDGTFKIAYTNNPAWCLYEFVVNDDWGMSSFTPITMDKYDVYEAAQWCDGMVPDGKGGLQPRYTLNTEIKEPRSAKEMARFIAGAFNAIFLDDGNGTAFLRVDKDDPARHLIAPENVVGGLFEYSYTDITQRYNFVTVSFTNPDLLYNTDRRVVTSPEHITEFGYVPTDMVALGCNDEQEALRRGMYKILTSTTECLLVSFKMNRLGLFLRPFEIALIADPDLGYGISGRLASVANDRMSLTLRDPVYLEAGVSYKATFQIPNPSYPTNSDSEFQLVEYPILNVANGLTSTLTFSQSLSEALPEKAVFSITQTGTGTTTSYGSPKPFRIMGVEEVDGNPDQVQVNAIEVNRNKFYDIDHVTFSGVRQYSTLSLRTLAAPATINVTPTMHTDGTADLLVEWDRVQGAVRYYEVQYSYNNGPMQNLTPDGGTSVHMQNVPNGAYTFYVRAVGLDGNKSPPVGYRIDLTDPVIANPGGVGAVGGLRPEGGTWRGRDVKMVWDPSRPVGFSHYLVKVKNPSNPSQVYRAQIVETEEFLYTAEMNAADHGGTMARSVVFDVVVYTTNLDISNNPQVSSSTTYTAQNAAPDMPSGVTMSWVDGGLRVAFTQPTDNDLVGTKVWIGTSHVWQNTDTPTHDLVGNPITIPGLDRSQTYYLHLAHYDSFGAIALNYSNEYTVTSGVPAAPTAVGFAANRRKMGAVNSKSILTASWTASSTPELVDHYVLAIRDTPQSAWVEKYVPASSASWTETRYFDPTSNTYQIRVKAVSNQAVSSAWSSIVDAVFTDDTTAPAVPSNLTVQGSYNMILATWNNPSDEDFAGVEIYVSANTTRLSTPTLTSKDQQLFLNNIASGESRYVWLRSYDYSGNFSAFVGPVSATAAAVPNLDTVAGAPGQVTGLTLSSASTVQTDGSVETVLTASWTARTEADLLEYEFQIKEGAAGVVTSGFTGTNTQQWIVKANTAYYVKVRAVDAASNKGLFSSEVSHTTSKDTIAPGGVSSVTAVPGFENIYLAWINPSDTDLDYVEVWESATNDRNTATVIARLDTSYYTRTNLAGGNTRYYWLRAVDTSQNVSGFSSGVNSGVSGTTLNINSGTQIGNGVITTAHITVNTLNGDRIQAGTLNADRIVTNSALASTITVGSGGSTLGTVMANAATGAQDPVSRINAGSTQIDPGKVVISGGTTLANWRNGGDATKIEGGTIAANTILANALKIGLRNINLAGMEFSVNLGANQISWTAGTISYVDDDGSLVSVGIAGNTAQWSTGSLYVYWVKGGTTLGVTTSYATAAAANNVVMATYRGGLDMVVNYGRTIIDGAQITTGSITANQLSTGQLLTQSAQIADGIITNAKIGTLSAGKITSGTITGQSLTLVDSKFVIDGVLQRIVINDTNNVTRVLLGALGSGAYGIRLMAANGTTILDTNGVNGAMVTGLGSLAYSNTADWSQLVNVPAFGGMAFLNSITGANISTYIAAGAIGTAYIADAAITNAKIGNLDASKITTGTLAAGQIAASSITTDKISVGGVTTSNLANGAVTTASSFYRVADIYDGTPGTSLGSVTLTTQGGIVSLIGFISYRYTNKRDIYAVVSLS